MSSGLDLESLVNDVQSPSMTDQDYLKLNWVNIKFVSYKNSLCCNLNTCRYIQIAGADILTLANGHAT